MIDPIGGEIERIREPSAKPGSHLGRARAHDRAADHERDLIVRIASRDEDAFEELYHRYAARVVSYLLRIVREVDLAEAGFDDTMMVVWEKAGTFRPEGRVSAWIFGIAHNKARQIQSRAGRSREVLCDEPTAHDDLPSGGDGAEDAFIRKTELQTILDAIDRLPEKQRITLELTFGGPTSYEEIATILDCPVNTVKTRMFHARKKLASLVPGLFRG